jgi:predicted permease
MSLRELVTPPFVANVLAVTLVLTKTGRFVPTILIDATEFIGSATIPVAILILGASLGGISFQFSGVVFDAARVILIKLIILPLFTIAILRLIGLGASYPILASVLVIQAASAPATATVVQVKHYGGDEQKISSIVLLAYLFCVIAMPFWVAVWKATSAVGH